MFPQRGPQSEFLVALSALVRHPAGVESPVFRQVAGCCEGLGTKFTGVRSLTGMSPHVPLQHFAAGECFVTERTPELVFRQVEALVLGEVPL